MFKRLTDCRRTKFSARKSLRFTLLLLPLLWAQLPHSLHTYAFSRRSSINQSSLRQSPQSIAVQNPAVTALAPGRAVEREISGDQTQTYQITLTSGQFVSLIVQQNGIDVVARLFAPDDKLIGEVDNESRAHGHEILELVAPASGAYRIDITPRYKSLPPGRYEIRVVELRAATERDRQSQQRRDQIARATKLYFAGKYDEALPLAEGLVGELEKAGETESPLMGMALNRVGGIYHGKGDYTKAETYFLRARSVLEKAVGADHPALLMVLYNLGIIYKEEGDYAKAAQFHRQALDGRVRVLGEDSTLVAASLTDLATVYRATGDYAKAEEMQLRALAIREKLQGPEDPEVGQVLFNLGVLYGAKKDWAKSAEVAERALRIWEKAFGPDDEDVGRVLNNLAVMYSGLGEYAKAEAAILRAIAISEKTIGPDNVRLADQLESLADIYVIKEEYAKAEPLYRRALRIQEKALPADHPASAVNLMGLARLYYYQGEYAKAEPLFQRALAIRKKALGPDHPDVAETLNGMARLYEAEGDIKRAVSFQSRADALIERDNELRLYAGSQNEQLAYFDFLTDQTNQTVTLHVRLARDDQRACDLAATTILQRKGRVLDEMAGSIASLQRRLGAGDQALLGQLNDTTSRLAKLVLGGPGQISAAEHQQQVKALEEQRDALESEVSRRSAGFYGGSRTVTLEAVKAAIPEDAALVEFAVYRPLVRRVGDVQKAYGEPRYVAYVIRHQGEVRWQELGDSAEIDARVGALREALSDPMRKDVERLARAVDLKVMQPVRTLLGSAKHLLISPDGPLNLIPFAALVDEQGHYLIEAHSITYLTSGRDLLRLQVRHESKGGPVVVADPAFGEPALVASVGRAGAKDGPGAGGPPRVDYSQIFFGPLPGVTEEVRALRTLLPQASFLTREQATKSALEKLSGPSILHVATHGFFLQDGQPTTAEGRGAQAKEGTRLARWVAHAENPLLRSGLALAGANQSGNGNIDGILTALEAAGLDLWGTKLVVLSACDTGVGEVKNGDGVYGLRRALVLAGAESQVMSLWAVSDRSTRDLVVGYYQALLQEGAGRGAALRQVQLQMLKDKSHRHPYYWAGFIQTGEWANLEGKR
ncbi:MAG: kinesin [Acidobacteria bacterium]|nr:MAG: kinesin [Acidobacteriota bacterium]